MKFSNIIPFLPVFAGLVSAYTVDDHGMLAYRADNDAELPSNGTQTLTLLEGYVADNLTEAQWKQVEQQLSQIVLSPKKVEKAASEKDEVLDTSIVSRRLRRDQCPVNKGGFTLTIEIWDLLCDRLEVDIVVIVKNAIKECKKRCHYKRRPKHSSKSRKSSSTSATSSSTSTASSIVTTTSCSSSSSVVSSTPTPTPSSSSSSSFSSASPTPTPSGCGPSVTASSFTVGNNGVTQRVRVPIPSGTSTVVVPPNCNGCTAIFAP